MKKNKKSIDHLRLLGFLFILVVPTTFVHAQLHSSELPSVAESTPPTEDPDLDKHPTVESIETKLEELKPQIESAQATVTDETATKLGVSLEKLRGRSDQLQALNAIYQQQLGSLSRLEELKASRENVDQEIAVFEERGLAEAPPYDLAFSDKIHDSVIAEERTQNNLLSEVDSAKTELELAIERRDKAQIARRTARDAATASDNPSDVSRLTWETNRARLEEHYYVEEVVARKLRRDVAQAELEFGEVRINLANQKMASVLAQTFFSRKEFEEHLVEIAARQDEVSRELPKLRDIYQANEVRRREAGEALQAAKGDDAINKATVDLTTSTVWVETSSRAVEVTEKKLSLMDREKVLWERRYEVLRGEVDDEILGEWKEETERNLEEIQRDRQIQESRLIDLRNNLLNTQTETSLLKEQNLPVESLHYRLKGFEKRESVLNDYLATLLPVELLALRLRDDIEREHSLVTIGERLSRFKTFVVKVWNYELFEIDDDSISLGKIISAILILVFGILIAGRFSRLLRSHILDKTPLNENATAAFEKMIYYMSLIGIILYALTVVSIPLTVFAFFGGAIAIAVGFGAQHIINNFISGFILMIERPIRIGDLVELNGIHGHIRHIGARSTRLHTSENIDLLIPNSQLLENVVTNWTLTDEKLRTSVTVGVVYGAPTERVMQLLMEATTEAKGVLPAPKPVILFTDFSDNALIFEIHFWVKMRRIMDKRLVESTIRFNIDQLFRENDIIIAFPQRDVHIDTINPIEIRMVDEHKL